MGGILCWLLAIVGLGVAVVAAYYVARVGAALAVKRDRQQHLAIVNAARRRSGKPPLSEDDLPPEATPEPDPLIERLFGIGRQPGSGFDVQKVRQAAPAESSPEPMSPATPQPSRAASGTAVSPLAAQRPLPVVPVEQVGSGEPAQPSASGPPLIVLLEAKERELDVAKLKSMAEKAWGVEFPDHNDATDWAVMTHPGMGMLSCGGYKFIVENHATSYFQDAEAAAAAVKELRTQQAIRNCRAWRSVGLVGQDEPLSDDAAYALLAKFAAELAGGHTLGVYLPRLERFFPYDTTTLKALLSDSPLEALREAYIEWVPLVASDDQELEQAMREARDRLGEFKEAFASRSITGSGREHPYLIKASFSGGGETEHMWVEVTAIRGDMFTGVLRSSPVLIPDLVEGEEVTVQANDVSDWIATLNGQSIGNFTGPVIQRRHADRSKSPPQA